MRTVTYGAACSLDGFIATPEGGVDWLHFSRDVQTATSRYWASVDTVLMGRRTWEAALAHASDSGGAPAGLSGVTTYVFSRSLTRIEHPGVRLVRGDAGAFVRDLRAQPGRGICVMGGGVLAGALLAAGVVDEVGLNIHPVLLGAGVPLFRDAGRRIALELIESRTIDGGCVLASYRVRAPDGSA
jgi:dihydrofolate reductase